MIRFLPDMFLVAKCLLLRPNCSSWVSRNAVSKPLVGDVAIVYTERGGARGRYSGEREESER